MTKNTELIVFEKLKPLEVFTEKGTESILNQIKKEKDNFKGDISTVKSRDEIRSFARKFATSKSKLDELGKKLVSGWKDQAKLVDNERKKIRDTLDEWRDEVRQPLTDFEDAEKKRIGNFENRITDMISYKDLDINSSGQANELMKKLTSLYSRVEHWQEFDERAKNVYSEVTIYLVDKRKDYRERELEQAELEKLRKEKEEREKKEREEQIIRETEENIRRVEREKAERVAKEAEAQRYRLEAEKKAAEQAKINAEERAKEAARIGREEKEQAEIQAKKDQEEAVRLERARAEAKRQQEIEEAKAREADLEHRTKINNEAANAIAKAIREDGEMMDNVALIYAKRALIAIAKGKIPYIFIKY